MDYLYGAEFDQAATIATDTAKVAFSSSFFLNAFIIGGLSHLLNMIQNLSIIVHMQLVNVKTPANAQIFFSKLLSIVAFDIIDGLPVEDWLIENLQIFVQDTLPLTINFDALGYESALFVFNMGSLILI